MKFIVIRTSDWFAKPCEEAKIIKCFYDFGNYKKEDTQWSVDFDSLDELMSFIKKYGGRIVIEVDSRVDYCDDKGNRIPVIEIYDEWRE